MERSRLEPIVEEFIVVAAGGLCGALARHGVGLLFAASLGRAVWATLAVNLSGSFLIGLVLPPLISRRPHHLLVPFLTVGVLGSYTTFSQLSLDFVGLAVTREPWQAFAYLTASLAGGVLLVWLGYQAGRRLVEVRP